MALFVSLPRTAFWETWLWRRYFVWKARARLISFCDLSTLGEDVSSSLTVPPSRMQLDRQGPRGRMLSQWVGNPTLYGGQGGPRLLSPEQIRFHSPPQGSCYHCGFQGHPGPLPGSKSHTRSQKPSPKAKHVLSSILSIWKTCSIPTWHRNQSKDERPLGVGP